MWTYRQKTGELLLNGQHVGHGYSGWDDGDGVAEPGEGKNDPSMQGVRGIGPIPVGDYSIDPPSYHPTAGPYTMRLEPMTGTITFGRSGFLIHGDSLRKPGTASHGCIILAPALRAKVWESGERHLRVESGEDKP